MADAKICDRCGSFYKDDSAYGAFTKIARLDSTYKVVKKSFNLCQSCRRDFDDWLERSENENG